MERVGKDIRQGVNFILQMKKAVKIKYPKSSGWHHIWVFDHSSCHAAMSNDALHVNHMNVRPGGQQRIMHDTIYNERPTENLYSGQRR